MVKPRPAGSTAAVAVRPDGRGPVRDAGSFFVDTADRALDVIVAPDGTSTWKDEVEVEAFSDFAPDPARPLPAMPADWDLPHVTGP